MRVTRRRRAGDRVVTVAVPWHAMTARHVAPARERRGMHTANRLCGAMTTRVAAAARGAPERHE